MRQIDFLPLFGPPLQNTERHPSPHFAVMGTFSFGPQKETPQAFKESNTHASTQMDTRQEHVFLPSAAERESRNDRNHDATVGSAELMQKGGGDEEEVDLRKR